jgi:ligand-binding domain of hormone receptor
MNQFKNYANRSVKFATRIPGFMNLQNVTDQIQLVKSSIHSLIILCLQRLNNSSIWNYFNVIDKKLNDEFEKFFPFIKNIHSDIDKIYFYISSLKLDEKEFSLFLSLIIISTSNIHLNEFLLIDSTQTEITCILCDYMDCKRGQKNRDFYTLMFLLPSLRKLNAIIQDYIKNQVPKNMEFPAFFSRVYLNEQDIVSF